MFVVCTIGVKLQSRYTKGMLQYFVWTTRKGFCFTFNIFQLHTFMALSGYILAIDKLSASCSPNSRNKSFFHLTNGSDILGTSWKMFGKEGFHKYMLVYSNYTVFAKLISCIKVNDWSRRFMINLQYVLPLWEQHILEFRCVAL